MIEVRVSPYEVLIRLGPDGYQAGHVVDIERLVDTETGEVRAERELPARAVTVPALSDLIGEASASLLAQIDRLKAEVEDLKARHPETPVDA